MTHDGQWHEYDVRMVIDGDLTALRLDPGSAPGEVQIDWIAVHRGGLHPLEIVAVEQTAGAVNVRLKNHSDQTISATLNGSPHSLAARSELNVPLPVTGQRSLAVVPIRVDAPGLTPIARTVWVHRVETPIDAVTRTVGGLTIEAARDGTRSPAPPQWATGRSARAAGACRRYAAPAEAGATMPGRCSMRATACPSAWT